MHIGNLGANIMHLLVEFAKDTYILGVLRATPYLENLTKATSIQLAFAINIISYHKESSLE